jgi:hypothetical protein
MVSPPRRRRQRFVLTSHRIGPHLRASLGLVAVYRGPILELRLPVSHPNSWFQSEIAMRSPTIEDRAMRRIPRRAKSLAFDDEWAA